MNDFKLTIYIRDLKIFLLKLEKFSDSINIKIYKYM